MSYTHFSFRVTISLLRPLEPSIERERRRPRPPADAVESLRSHFSPFISLPRKSSERPGCVSIVCAPSLAVHDTTSRKRYAAFRRRQRTVAETSPCIPSINHHIFWQVDAASSFLALLFTRIGGFLVRQVQIGQVPIVWKKREGRERAREREIARVVARWHVPRLRIAKGGTFATTAVLARLYEQSRPEVCGTRNAYANTSQAGKSRQSAPLTSICDLSARDPSMRARSNLLTFLVFSLSTRSSGDTRSATRPAFPQRLWRVEERCVCAGNSSQKSRTTHHDDWRLHTSCFFNRWTSERLANWFPEKITRKDDEHTHL